MRFRDFYLNEGTDPRNMELQLNDAIETFFAHCEDSLPLIENNTPLKRNSKVKIGGFAIVDPTKVKRRSVTSPILTIINDLLAEKYPHLPRRNYSVFGTFGYPKSLYGPNRQYIIPFNNCNFAVAGSDDLVLQSINKNAPSPNFSFVADSLLGHHTNLLYSTLSDSSSSSDTFIKSNLQKSFGGERMRDDETVIQFISRNLSPRITHVGSTSKIVRNVSQYINDDNEIWTEGPVLALDAEVWDPFRSKVVKQK